MDLTLRDDTSGVVQGNSMRWLGSPHGVETAETITLDVALFTEADHYPDGVIKAGTVLARNAAGEYGPAGNETENVGFLSADLRVKTTDVADSTRLIGALLIMGKIIKSELPVATGTAGGLDPATEAALNGAFVFIETY